MDFLKQKHRRLIPLAVLLALGVALLALRIFSSLSAPSFAYMTLDECTYAQTQIDGSILVTDGEGLIELSNVDPAEYADVTVSLRLTNAGSTLYDLTGSVNGRVFIGLGNESHPFNGEIRYIGGSKMPISAPASLFNCLTTDAVLPAAFELVPNSGADEPVLAKDLVAGEGSADWSVVYYPDGDSYENGGLLGTVETGVDLSLSLSAPSDAFPSGISVRADGDASALIGRTEAGCAVRLSLPDGLPAFSVTVGGDGGLLCADNGGSLSVLGFSVSLRDGMAVGAGENAGGLVGLLRRGASLSVGTEGEEYSCDFSVSSSGDGYCAGGLIGRSEDGAALSLLGAWGMSGSVRAGVGGCAGGLIGKSENAALDYSRLSVTVGIGDGASVSAQGEGSCVGGYIGKAVYPEDGALSLSSLTVSNVSVGEGQYCGGLFGSLATSDGASLSILGEESGPVSVTYSASDGGGTPYFGGLVGSYRSSSLSGALILRGLSVSADAAYSDAAKTVGGMIGIARNDESYIRVEDTQVRVTLGNGKYKSFGGILGEGYNEQRGVFGVLDVEDVRVADTLIVTNGAAENFGGLVGKSGETVLRLSGTTDLSDAVLYRAGSAGKRRSALLVGDNTGALVYACGDGSDADTWRLIRPSDGFGYPCSDLGEYGEVIRLGGAMAETADTSAATHLFTFDPSAHTVTVHPVSYSIGSVRDFAAYCVASDCADAAGKSGSGLILSAAADPTRTLTLSGDVDLTGTGLTALSHRQTFSGTLDGGTHTVTLATGEPYGIKNGAPAAADQLGSGQIYYHRYAGLFSTMTGSVHDLTLDGSMDIIGAEYAGALAGYGYAARTTLRSITVRTAILDRYEGIDQQVGGLLGCLSSAALDASGITLNNSLTVVNASGKAYSCGGLFAGSLLGNNDVTLRAVSVDGAALSAEGMTFGGLFHIAEGKMHVEKGDAPSDYGIRFSGAPSSFSGASVSDVTSGLIVCRGEKLYFILDEGALTMPVPPSVTVTGNNCFDELVGVSITHGNRGVVSIETGNKGHLDESGCTTYQKQLPEDHNNPHTRYYYDMYAIAGDTGRNLGGTVDSAEDMMAFSVYRTCASNLRWYFVRGQSDTWLVTGTIDLSGYSYYPIDWTNLFSSQKASVTFRDATVILDYDTVYQAERTAANKVPNEPKQHYAMHTAIFDNCTSDVTVEGLTLKGTAGYLGRSGALVAGEISGTDDAPCAVKIDGLTLDGLRIAGYISMPGYAPLLINRITQNVNLGIQDLTTKNYASGAAATSLLGNVGLLTEGDTVWDAQTDVVGRKISLTFGNICLDGRTYASPAPTWDGTRSYNHNDGGGDSAVVLFTKATLLNAFYAKDAASCRGVYNFNADEDTVTYGKELSVNHAGRKQFYYYDTFNEKGAHVWDKTKSSVSDNPNNGNNDSDGYFASGYLPYVFLFYDENENPYCIELLVNQASAAAASGCGTYGHPYVITASNVSWLYDVAVFLDGNSNVDIELIVDKNVLAKGTFASGDYHNEARENDITLEFKNGRAGANKWAVTNGSYTLPSDSNLTQLVRRYLANAYYQFDTSGGPIVINLGENDFYGLGGAGVRITNAESPVAFAGVLIGADTAFGTDITVNLGGAHHAQAGGLVKFANGCVIKDLNVTYTGNYTVDVAYTVSGNSITSTDEVFFGGLIGYAIGGDNIIDHVSSDFAGATLCVQNSAYHYLANVGGYVGLIGGVMETEENSNNHQVIEASRHIAFTAGGGVIFRRMAGAAGLFSVKVGESTVDTAREYDADAEKNYLYWNPYVGRVMDGYACYDAMTAGDGRSTAATLNNTNKNYSIPTIYDTAEPSIAATYVVKNWQYVSEVTWNIKNEQGLWLLSSILNSGAGIHGNDGLEWVGGVKVPVACIGWRSSTDNAYMFGKARSTRATYDFVGQALTQAQIADECYNEAAWSSFPGDNATRNYGQTSYLVDKSGCGEILTQIGNGDGKKSLRTNTYLLSSDMDMTSYHSGFRGIGYSHGSYGVNIQYNNYNVLIHQDRSAVFNYFGSGEGGVPSDTVRTVTLDMSVHEYEMEQFYLLGVGFLTTIDIPKTTEGTVSALRLSGNVAYTAWDFDGRQTGGTPGEVGQRAERSHIGVGGLFGKFACAHDWNTGTTVRFTHVYLEDLTVSGGRFTGGFGGVATGRDKSFTDSSHYGSKQIIMTDCGYDGLHVISEGYAGGLFGYISFYSVKDVVENLETSLNDRSRIQNCTFRNAVIESDFSAPYFTDLLKKDSGYVMGIGGLFGLMSAGSTGGCVRIEDVDILNVTVESTAPGVTSSMLDKKGGHLGGIVGVIGKSQAQYSIALLGVRVEGCTIGHRDNGNTVKDLASSVAGFVGSLNTTKGIYCRNSANRNNLLIDNDIRWGVNIGGAIGFSEKALSDVENIELTGNRLYVDHDSLDAVGRINGKNAFVGGVIGAQRGSNTVIRHIQETDNTLIGVCVGGVAGLWAGYSDSRFSTVSDLSVTRGYIALSYNMSVSRQVNGWDGVRAAGVIGEGTGVNQFDLYNIRLENVLIGALLNPSTEAQRSAGTFTACRSFDADFVGEMTAHNVGLNEGKNFRSYPYLVEHNKLNSATASAQSGNNLSYSLILGYTKAPNDAILNVIGLYLHTDDGCFPYLVAITSNNGGALPDRYCNIVYADYSGERTVTGTDNVAGVSINPQIALPGVTVYGNFVGEQLPAIGRDLPTAAQNYRNSYYNVSQAAGLVDTLAFFNTAPEDRSGESEQIYLTRYHTQETVGAVPDEVDFPVFVIDSADDLAVDARLKDLICLLTNVASFDKISSIMDEIACIEYKWSSASEQFQIADHETLTFSDGAFATTRYYDSSSSSFLLVRVTFADPSGSGESMYVDIPVLVCRVMEFNVDLRILTGSSYLPSVYRGVKNLIVSDHGDVFTAMLEYNYRRSAEDWNADLDNGVDLLWSYRKSLFLGPSATTLPIGTQFVLVDSVKNGKAYYFRNDSMTESVDFSSFRDSAGEGWECSPISEVLGLLVTEDPAGHYVTVEGDDIADATVRVNGVYYKYVTENGEYAIRMPSSRIRTRSIVDGASAISDTKGRFIRTANEEEATVRVGGICYRYVAEGEEFGGAARYSITLPDGVTMDSALMEGFLVSGERYFISILTPKDTLGTLNNVMSYGDSVKTTPLLGDGNAIATKPAVYAEYKGMDGNPFAPTRRYVLTSSFTQQSETTVSGDEDMTVHKVADDQYVISASFRCSVSGTDPEQFATFRNYILGNTEMYQAFDISFTEYGAEPGVSGACYILANAFRYSYALYDSGGTKVTTVGQLRAMSGNMLSEGAAQQLLDMLSEERVIPLSGRTQSVRLVFDGFEMLMNYVGEGGFSLVCETQIVFPEAALNDGAQFPGRNIYDKDDKSGIGISAWSKIAYSRDGLDHTDFAVGSADTHRFYVPKEEGEKSNAVLVTAVEDLQTLSGNGLETDAFDITLSAVYDYSMVDPEVIKGANGIRYRIELSKKTADSERRLPMYAKITEDTDLYFTDEGDIRVSSANSVLSPMEYAGGCYSVSYDLTLTEEATHTVTVSCSPITGDLFEERGFTYGNYQILIWAELLCDAEPVARTIASDYIVYTNAKITSDLIG